MKPVLPSGYWRRIVALPIATIAALRAARIYTLRQMEKMPRIRLEFAKIINALEHIGGL